MDLFDEYERRQRREDFRFRVAMYAIAGAGVAALAYFTLSDADAHQAASGMKYDGWCCNGTAMTGDCQPIPFSAVQELPDGYRITLRPGDHRLVTQTSHTWDRRQSDTRRSTDGQYHACLFPDEGTLRCFYAPPPSF